MRLRALAVTTALALAATGLTACSSKIGLAATVGDRHLTINELNKQVKRDAAPYPDRQTGATIYPTTFALQAWVQDQLFSLALSKATGVKAPAGADVHQVLAALNTAIGSDPAAYFRMTYDKLGYTSEFGALVLHQQETLLLLAHSFEPTVAATQLLTDLQSSQALNNDLLKALNGLHVPVSVAGRYGAWDPKTFGLSSARNAGLPSFVTIGTDTQAAASPAGQ